MSWLNVGIAGAGIAASLYTSSQSGKATGAASQDAKDAAIRSAQHQKNVYRQTSKRVAPWRGAELAAQKKLEVELGLAPGQTYFQRQPPKNYMLTPAYQAVQDEGVAAVDQGAATGGSLYSGLRGKALRDVGHTVQMQQQQMQQHQEQQFYTNYMNMLQNMAQPTTTMGLGAMAMGQAADVGRDNIAAQNTASDYAMQGTAAQNAAIADIVGGVTNMGTAYMNSRRPDNTDRSLTTQQTQVKAASTPSWMGA